MGWGGLLYLPLLLPTSLLLSHPTSHFKKLRIDGPCPGVIEVQEEKPAVWCDWWEGRMVIKKVTTRHGQGRGLL
jgi:hypothetical protein